MRVPRSTKIKINGVFGVGTNDADYQVNVRVDGKTVWKCKYYERWANMLFRCYSEALRRKRPSYSGCTTCDEWLLFSNFKSWMQTQDWQGKELDKDILFPENKIYSPETCVFVSEKINTFIEDRSLDRGEHPLGVSYHKSKGRFNARCNNPLSPKSDFLGSFTDPHEAHLAWKARKHLYACQLADSELVDDPRVAEALRKRYI